MSPLSWHFRPLLPPCKLTVVLTLSERGLLNESSDYQVLTSTISENSFSVKRRSMQITTYNVIVQVGSVISSQIYRKDDAPYYHRGNKILVSFCAFSIFICLFAKWYFGHLVCLDRLVAARYRQTDRNIRHIHTTEQQEGTNLVDHVCRREMGIPRGRHCA